MTRVGRKGSYAAPALEKAFEIIELLADNPGGALISEMAARLDRSLGELFRIVIVMEQHGYLQKSPIDDRYSVAYKFLDMAHRATPAQDLIRAAQDEMRALASDVMQSCHLVVADGGHGLVIAREENPGIRGFALKVGATINIVESCSGQVILAFSSPAQYERIVDLAQSQSIGVIDRAALATKRGQVRKRGFDGRKSPITQGVTDISYPLFGFDGSLMGALTIPFLQLIDGSQKVGFDAARDRLRQAAVTISAALGYRSPD